MLDEGVGGSLTTHLQEVLPGCKGEQSLTFEETHWLLSAPRGTPRPIMRTISMIAGPSYVRQPIPLKSEITERFELETPKTNLYHLTIHFEVRIPKTIRLSQFYTRKL